VLAICQDEVAKVIGDGLTSEELDRARPAARLDRARPGGPVLPDERLASPSWSTPGWSRSRDPGRDRGGTEDECARSRRPVPASQGAAVVGRSTTRIPHRRGRTAAQSWPTRSRAPARPGRAELCGWLRPMSGSGPRTPAADGSQACATIESAADLELAAQVDLGDPIRALTDCDVCRLHPSPRRHGQPAVVHRSRPHGSWPAPLALTTAGWPRSSKWLDDARASATRPARQGAGRAELLGRRGPCMIASPSRPRGSFDRRDRRVAPRDKVTPRRGSATAEARDRLRRPRRRWRRPPDADARRYRARARAALDGSTCTRPAGRAGRPPEVLLWRAGELLTFRHDSLDRSSSCPGVLWPYAAPRPLAAGTHCRMDALLGL